MNIEEKKDPSRNVKGGIEMRKLFIIEAERDGIGCGNCPFADTRCGADKEVHDLFEEVWAEEVWAEEVWAEEHGYVKKEDSVENPDHIEATKKSEDPVNPDHYKVGKLQTIEQMLIMFGIDEVTAFCKLNAYKYQARAGLKGDAVMDHKKADWYMRLYKEIRYCDNIASGLNRMKDFFKKEEENAADH